MRPTLAVVASVILFASIVGSAQVSSSPKPPAKPASIVSAFAAIDPAVQVKQMQRGVNIIGYDPIWKDFEKRRFQEKFFKQLADSGFHTVRVNLQAFWHMDSLNRLNPAWFKTLDWVVDNATKNGLTVILDEHDFTLCAEDAAMCREKLLAFWEQVAPRYKNTGNNVVYEILNEPNGELTAAAWNVLLRDVLATIRLSNPERNVIVGPARWNSIDQLDALLLPQSDRHLIVTVHYYAPMEFTHQGAPWNKETAGLSGVTWGTEPEKQKVIADFAVAQRWAHASGRPLFLGEFGAYDKGDMESRAKYTSFVARTAESQGWAWAYWQFDSDFILYDISRDKWVEPIRDALIPASMSKALGSND